MKVEDNDLLNLKEMIARLKREFKALDKGEFYKKEEDVDTVAQSNGLK